MHTMFLMDLPFSILPNQIVHSLAAEMDIVYLVNVIVILDILEQIATHMLFPPLFKKELLQMDSLDPISGQSIVLWFQTIRPRE